MPHEALLINDQVKLVVPDFGDRSYIEILVGKYKGIQIIYGVVDFENSTDDCLKFDYDIKKTAGKRRSSLVKNKDFIRMIGDILSYMILLEAVGPQGIIGTDWENLNLRGL